MSQQPEQNNTAEVLLIAKNAAAKEVFHMPFEKAFIRIIIGDTNFTMSEVESVIDKTAFLYASQQTASLQKQVEELREENGRLKSKSDKWDALGEKIGKCYQMDDDGEFIDSDSDLGTIGEIAASAYGYL